MKGEFDPTKFVDMRNWSGKGNNGMIPYDYGFWGGGDNWYHANNGVPTEQQNFGSMNVKVSTLKKFSEPLENFDTQVICVTCERWDFNK